MPNKVPATTVNKVCGSGLAAVIQGVKSIALGDADVVVAGGMESMSNAPYLLAKARSGYRVGHDRVLDHMLLDGLEDAYETGRSMGDFLDAEGRRIVERILDQRGNDRERHELRFERPDGSALWAEVSTCPISEPDGRHAGMLAMVTDATDRRRRAEELRGSNDRLRAMVGDLERHKQDMAQIAELKSFSEGTLRETTALIGQLDDRVVQIAGRIAHALVHEHHARDVLRVHAIHRLLLAVDDDLLALPGGAPAGLHGHPPTTPRFGGQP